MKAWMLDQPGQPLALRDIDTPHARPGAVLVRMEAVPLLSYTRDYLNGALPYAYPPGPFTPGTNGVGTIIETGAGVHHFRAGQRVAVNPYLTSTESVDAPAEILIGLTGISADSGPCFRTFHTERYERLPSSPLRHLSPSTGWIVFRPTGWPLCRSSPFLSAACVAAGWLRARPSRSTAQRARSGQPPCLPRWRWAHRPCSRWDAAPARSNPWPGWVTAGWCR
jgi:hypothetical protein